MKSLDISVIIPVFNAASTIEIALTSLIKQNYPLKELILIDNCSNDNSLGIIKKFKKKNKKINIIIIEQKKNLGIVESYNKGVKVSKNKYLVFMHSDCGLSTKFELAKLVKPIENNTKIVATYPLILHPERIWTTYNFWEKCHFARVVGTHIRGMSGTFDCYKKKVLLKNGGFNKKDFDNETGGEDWDFYYKMKKEGEIVSTDATVEHYHELSEQYSFSDYLKKRKHLARSYGRILKIYGTQVGSKGVIAFLTKPVLALGLLLPSIQIIIGPLMLLFSVFITKKMFLTEQTLFDKRILLLPFINIFLIYYESFWIFESFLSTGERRAFQLAK